MSAPAQDRAILNRDTGEIFERDDRDIQIEILREEMHLIESDRTPEAREVIKELRLKLAGTERDLRKANAALARQERNLEAERKTYIRRPVIEDLFKIWQEIWKHPRSKLTPERFDACKARLEEDYSELDLAMAIHGHRASPPTKDGQVYDGFHIPMASGGNVERYANLCPKDKRTELRATKDGQTSMETEE